MELSSEMTGMSDDVIDYVTTEYLREAQYNGPRLPKSNASFSYTSGAPASDGWRPTGSIYGSLSSGEVHGQPVPGDRDFGRSHQGIGISNHHRGGPGSFSFLSEAFAPDRLVEMMKMLRIMRSAHERNFGSRKVPGNFKQGAAGSGLEEEHKEYVENLGNEWRDVARILRCKSKQKDESAECSVSEISSAVESCYSSEVVELLNGSVSSSNFAPAEFGNFDEGALSARVFHGKAKDSVEDEHITRVRVSKGKVPVDDRDEGGHVGVEVPGQMEDDEERQDGLSESSRMSAAEVFGEDNRGGPGITDIAIGAVDTTRGISLEGPNKAMWSESQHEAESCDECDGVDIREKSVYEETIPQELAPESEHVVYPTSLASSDSEFEKNPIDLDAEEISVEKTPRKEFRHLRSKFSQQPLIIPTDLESPSEKTSDKRTKGRRNNPFSPFKDRSNIPSGSEQRRTPRGLLDEDRRANPQPWVAGLRTPEKSPKRRASFDFRRRTDLKGSQVSSNASDDSPDLPVVPKHRLLRSATLDVRLSTQRGKAASEEPKASTEACKDANDSSTPLDIPPFPTPLSSIRVDRTDKDCSTSEQTHRSCASCQRRRAASNDDRNSLGKLGNRSPSSSQHTKSGRNVFAIPDAASKHSNMEKTPGMKKPNVLLKKASSRLSSSQEFEDSEEFHRTSFPLSSEESPQSTGFPGAPNESKSGSKDTPTLRRSATWNDRSQTSEAKLTPGGPRRGGKVDRVARFAEMQSLWKSDKFLNSSGKRKSQGFHRLFSELHESNERFYARERSVNITVICVEPLRQEKENITRLLSKLFPEGPRSHNEPPPFVVPSPSSIQRTRSSKVVL